MDIFQIVTISLLIGGIGFSIYSYLKLFNLNVKNYQADNSNPLTPLAPKSVSHLNELKKYVVFDETENGNIDFTQSDLYFNNYGELLVTVLDLETIINSKLNEIYKELGRIFIDTPLGKSLIRNSDIIPNCILIMIKFIGTGKFDYPFYTQIDQNKESFNLTNFDFGVILGLVLSKILRKDIFKLAQNFTGYDPDLNYLVQAALKIRIDEFNRKKPC